MTALGRNGLICILVTMVGVPIGFLCYMALAQEPAEPGSEPAAELIGASAFAKEGTEVGEVSAVTVGGDGQIKEVRVTAALPLGLGERTVVVERGSFIALRGGRHSRVIGPRIRGPTAEPDHLARNGRVT